MTHVTTPDTTPGTATCAVCRAQWSSVPCRACGHRVCRRCCDDHADGGHICRTCAYGVMGADMVQRARTVEAAESRPQVVRAGRARRVLAALALVGSLATTLFVVLPQVREAAERERIFAYGPVGEGDPGLEDCLEGLWGVRAALDRHVHAHEGALPRSLDAVDGAPRTCPGCGGAWSAQFAADGTWRIGCPTPGQHDRVAIFLDHRVGPPQIQMVRPAGDPNR